jgi:hypothetical protein
MSLGGDPPGVSAHKLMIVADGNRTSLALGNSG